MNRVFRWAVLGCGKISHDFVNALYNVPNAEIVAVAARDIKQAHSFASKFNIEHYFDSYEDLVKLDYVDIVYVGTINSKHYEHARLCINSNKHSLVEKPMTINSELTKSLYNEAKSKQLYIMEAMWTRFIPAVQQTVKLIKESNKIGKICHISSNFGVKFSEGIDRVFKPEYGGGTTLDIGIYPIQLALLFGGRPTNIIVNGELDDKYGVDLNVSVQMKFKNNTLATLYWSGECNTSCETYIFGTNGSIKLHSSVQAPTIITITNNEGKQEHLNFPLFPLTNVQEKLGFNFNRSEALAYEVIAAQEAISNNQFECAEYTINDSILVSEVLDEVRRQLKLCYRQLGEADIPPKRFN